MFGNNTDVRWSQAERIVQHETADIAQQNEFEFIKSN